MTFLQHLLSRESGINPKKFEWYAYNLDKYVIRYPAVASPGVPLRDHFTGALTLRRITVREYFAALGVESLFSASDPRSLIDMQYAAINPLGFVGYQFGERILIQHGYYQPVRRQPGTGQHHEWLDCYYVGSVHSWARGVTECIYQRQDNALPIIATSTNVWDGTFLGKNGISSLEDLRRAESQETMVKEIMAANERMMADALIRVGVRYPDALPTMTSASIGAALPPVSLRCTRSGLLACAHLCGVQAVIDLLSRGVVAVDEFGTSMIDYLIEFANYDIAL